MKLCICDHFNTCSAHGGWSTNGITTKMINSSYVQCSASHLTCFAVLFGNASSTSTSETTVRKHYLCQDKYTYVAMPIDIHTGR